MKLPNYAGPEEIKKFLSEIQEIGDVEFYNVISALLTPRKDPYEDDEGVVEGLETEIGILRSALTVLIISLYKSHRLTDTSLTKLLQM